MRIIKKTIAVICTAAFALGASALTVFAEKPTDALSRRDESYTPLYTTAPDSSYGGELSGAADSGDYALFYTQTTLLALVAGYLVLFKAKGIDHSQKMHRRKTEK